MSSTTKELVFSQSLSKQWKSWKHGISFWNYFKHELIERPTAKIKKSRQIGLYCLLEKQKRPCAKFNNSLSLDQRAHRFRDNSILGKLLTGMGEFWKLNTCQGASTKPIKSPKTSLAQTLHLSDFVLKRQENSVALSSTGHPWRVFRFVSVVEIKIWAIYGHVYSNYLHTVGLRLSRVRHEIGRIIAFKTTCERLIGSVGKDFIALLFSNGARASWKLYHVTKKYHSFLKLCKFWETSIRISPTVYQHKIFVHGAVSWFRSIDRSILRLIFPSRVLARTKRFINRWWKLTLFIVISFCIKNIYLVRLHLTSDSIMS